MPNLGTGLAIAYDDQGIVQAAPECEAAARRTGEAVLVTTGVVRQ